MSIKILISLIYLVIFSFGQVVSIGAEWNPTGDPIGGGPGYSDSVRHQDADYIVSTRAELQSALRSADSGNVIYIADSAEIDMTEARDTIPAWVTLASGRGRTLNDTISWGALLYSYQPESSGRNYMFALYDHCRVTGIRFRGSYSLYNVPRDTLKYFPHTNRCDGNEEMPLVSYRGDSTRIDNCEIYGWGGYAANFQGCNPSTYLTFNTIQHCHLHDGSHVYKMYPFCVQLKGGKLLVEACYTDMAHGTQRCSAHEPYDHSCEVRWCIQGPHSACNAYDGHSGPDSTGLTATIYIHNNTVQNESRACVGDVTGTCVWLPVPESVFIHNNWFWVSESAEANWYNAHVNKIRIWDNLYTPEPEAGLSGRIPNAVMWVDKDSGGAPLTVKFSAINSTDPNDNLRAFYWWFGDSIDSDNHIRSTDITDTVEHTFHSIGKHRVRLRVTDDMGCMDFVDTVINIVPDDGKNYLVCWISDRWHDNSVGTDTLYKRIYLGRQTDSDTHWLVYNKSICMDNGWEKVVVDITDSLTVWKSEHEDSLKIIFMMWCKNGWTDPDWKSSGATPYMLIDDVVIYGADIKNGDFEEAPHNWAPYGTEYIRSDGIWLPFRSSGGSGWNCKEGTGFVHSGNWGYHLRWYDANPDWTAGEYAAVKQTVAIIDTIPPKSPYIYAEKSGQNVDLTWNQVTTDEQNNIEVVDCYLVFRNTEPDFLPSPLDSIGNVNHPDTAYTDTGALNTSDNYYYLVKAVDWASNESKKSNMGYKFHKFVNENPGSVSDRNWISLPYNSEYDSVKDITDDVCPAGDPVSKITMLDEESQNYYSWIYHPVLGWYGNHLTYPNFPIELGQAYEMVTVTDDTVIFAGANEPDSSVVLNENTGRIADRNWISMPYNAAYDSVKDITDECSPLGNPVSKITMLDEESQNFYSWIYHSVLGWYGNHPSTENFPIVPGTGYEFTATKDTTWNPTEWPNVSQGLYIVVGAHREKHYFRIHAGSSHLSDRSPVWLVNDSDNKIGASISETHEGEGRGGDEEDIRISHIVWTHLNEKGYENIVFTTYRLNDPLDVLTEKSAGSVIVDYRSSYHLISFDVGNFENPWKHGEEAVLIVEATMKGKGYYDIIAYELDGAVDIQELREIMLKPYNELVSGDGSVYWDKIANKNVVGYSLYQDNKRLNEKVLTQSRYRADGIVNLKLVIKGGYETVYGSQGLQSRVNMDLIPTSYALDTSPNPFMDNTRTNYAVPKQTFVHIGIYDVSGRLVKTLISEVHNPGYYTEVWAGCDDKGQKAAAGIYFLRFNTDEFATQEKVLLIK